jgi:phage terminase large subunit-like protein
MTHMPAVLRGAPVPDIERQPEHVLRVVRRTPGAYYNQKHADWAAQFFPRYLRHFEGEWGGRPLQLAPWQEHEIIRPLFGWKRPDGSRLFRRAGLWVARKNGKTLLMAGIGAACFAGDMEPGCKIYCLGAKKEQAEIAFKGAFLMIQASPDLNERMQIFKTKILYPEINGEWVPLSGKAGGKHGLNAHMKLGDELHEWKTGDLDDFVRQSMGSRRQPLEIDVSTAGDINGYGYEVFQRDQRIMDGTIEDPSTLIAIYAADKDDDWRSPEVWRKANPNLDIAVKRTFLEDEARKALEDPAKETHFRRYHLNMWTQAGTRWIQAHKWAPCCDSEEGWRWLGKPFVRTDRSEDHGRGMLERFRGRKAYCGIDLSSNTDWSAVIWAMPEAGGDPKTRVHCRFYIPRANWDLRKRRDKVNLDRWEKIGCLRITEGNTIDYEQIYRETLEDAALLQVMGIGLDRKYANWIGPKLLEQYGEDVVTYIGQSYDGMGPGYKEIDRLIEGGPALFDHGNHPVLKWMASNVGIVTGRDGDILAMKDKKWSADRIDGIVALAMALKQAVVAPIASTSIYATRGLIVL